MAGRVRRGASWEWPCQVGSLKMRGQRLPVKQLCGLTGTSFAPETPGEVICHQLNYLGVAGKTADEEGGAGCGPRELHVPSLKSQELQTAALASLQELLLCGSVG